MKALYRKYRPTELSDVVGEEQVTKTLEASLKKGKIFHAYLFTGPRGCGKTSVARIFAHKINGFKYELEDFYPDILEIDAASNTGVDNIRELRERASIAPTEGKYKVYIIDEVHMLSKSAFNALLKTLEEPPRHVVFIMATTDAYKVPGTIISRSQVFEFQLAAPDVLHSHLKKIAEKEGIKITDDGLELIVRRGGGSFRDSISLLDQISTISDDEITAELISKSLGLPQQTKIQNLLDAYLAQNLGEITSRLKDLLSSGVRAEIIVEELINQIMEKPSPELLQLLKPLSAITNPFPEAKLLLAFTASIGEANLGASQDNKGFSPVNSQQLPNRTTTKNYRRSEVELAVVNSNTARRTPSGEAPELDSKANGREISRSEDHSLLASEDTLDVGSEPKAKSSSSGEMPSLDSQEEPFSWSSYYEVVHSASPSIADILNNTTHTIDGNTLIIIPEKPIYKTILSASKNLALLKKHLPPKIELKIADPSDAVISTNDPQISKLSAIMGGNIMEVQDNDGGSPF